MPYASRHYPFENKELVERSFPADFIAEGLDQTMKDLILEELNVREMKLARSANQARAALRQAKLPRHQGEGPGLREEHEGDFRQAQQPYGR
jgi:hypothetical protein